MDLRNKNNAEMEKNMKLWKKTGVSVLLALSLFLVMPQVVSAEEHTDCEFVDDHATVGTAETQFSLERAQMTEEQQKMYEQLLLREKKELKIGESLQVGTDEEGGNIYIICVSRDESLARAGWHNSSTTYNIIREIAGQDVLLAVVNLECEWYANGTNGYINSLKGTYTEKNSAWKCSWDDYKPATDYVHTLFLDLYSTGSSISIMFNASYAPYSETLSFSASEV